MTNSADAASLSAALARAEAEAPFLRRAMQREPELVDRLAAGDLAGALALTRAVAGETVAVRLRRERRRLALAVAIADLAGLLDLDGVTGLLSDFADRALAQAIAAAIEERVPGAPVTGLVALALGKHGSRELNYSSDIDPIFLFDPATLPRRAQDDPVDAAARLTRRVVQILQAPDADGIVFRVDLRLRPSPEATPPAVPINAAIGYYESAALPWERAAFIRARAAAGDMALGAHFLDAIRPFIWRRALDFGTISEIRGISRRIRSHHQRGQRFGPGYDLKRGRGGIREIEFFVQIHQLIHGGRDPALRAPATLPALAALKAAGRVDPDEADALAAAYPLYRRIEHRLQMIEDQQTHRLPEDAAALDGVARLDGLADGAALLARLAPPVATVCRIYDALDGEEAHGLPHDRDALEAALAEAGFDPAADAADRILGWRGGQARALRSASAQEALEAVLPGLIAALGEAPAPLAALNRFDDVVRALPSAINLFRLLAAQPPLARLLGQTLSLAPTLADMLGRAPQLIDGLIDASALALPPDTATLAARFAPQPGEDYQGQLDRVRRLVGELRFALGVQIVSAARDPLEVGAGYARVAEGAVQALAAATVTEFERVHGRVPGGELVILALGRLGGGILTHASDLDLVYLFAGDFMAESDGAKPLGATHYFNRLAQRVSAALSVPTAAGPLYEVDTRLRPSGAKGLLALSIESFRRYQAESAWTWEHMALTRARPIFGSAAARAALAAAIAETLQRPRDPAQLRADAVQMRGDMARHKPATGPLDVKLGPGGLVDLEFAIHVTQLTHRAGFDPGLAQAIAALGAWLPPGLDEAYALLSRMLVALRLIAPSAEAPAPPARAALARACGMADWPALLAALDAARQRVEAAWQGIAAPAGERA
ncbi:bifunctional [glutamine synthetase] adenylyltransferase/[glutamine synthetase]-adenylyl-L-tyrosine phosphorylase [Sphingomonas morindae]|uniref:Bifunctional [glutamine synthetase] adenylyltransferase/[glutamine synthetase]-adenylyl-L-tyrosine phosphorylase n=1 Tax=Sphingomonas morindae TaxID=1541170 RepID=A0ABY4X8P1_9SPHN|nr:bifunctional [glutamine synthetase] adenylyltransferase/[glutamine synthetase]-adenylyl-L-tyrosine phosphorylase [Sphingomonas morindae]USI73292.1 bifunctional [glutamine synthetase] adenylyltransferase/[glutamine synthetase]-adenylyl-L-tyrosine phosphorylase [Sphingomonas morindae]